MEVWSRRRGLLGEGDFTGKSQWMLLLSWSQPAPARTLSVVVHALLLQKPALLISHLIFSAHYSPDGPNFQLAPLQI